MNAQGWVCNAAPKVHSPGRCPNRSSRGPQNSQEGHGSGYGLSAAAANGADGEATGFPHAPNAEQGHGSGYSPILAVASGAGLDFLMLPIRRMGMVVDTDQLLRLP